MNILLSTIGRRTYLAKYFRDELKGLGKVIGTSDRHCEEKEFSIGLNSCDRKYIVPPIKTGEYINSLLKICQKENVGLMASLFDYDSYVLSNDLDSFRRINVVPFISSREVNEICFDKQLTAQFLENNGFQGPLTFSALDEFVASGVGFPVIVKPRRGFASEGIQSVGSMQQLEALLVEKHEFIIQEKLGGCEYSFDILNDLEGKVVSCVVKRKIKMRAGETDQAITVKDKKLVECAVAIGECLRHVGPLDVDLFVSSRGVSILEFNPRFGGGYPLSYAAGANFPKMMLEMAQGVTPSAMIGCYEEGLVMLKDMSPKIFRLPKLLEGVEIV